MTKEMTAGRRVDILTDALIHYADHRLQQFGQYFIIKHQGCIHFALIGNFHLFVFISTGPSLVMKVRKRKNLMENAMMQLQGLFSKFCRCSQAHLINVRVCSHSN